MGLGGLACGLVVVMETKARMEWKGHQDLFQYGKETSGQEVYCHFRFQIAESERFSGSRGNVR